MKDRLLSLLLALAALALFWLLLFPKPQAAPQVGRPLSVDEGPDGYLALARWLGAEHVPVTRLRRRYDHLDDAQLAAPAAGNLLIVTLPYAVAVRDPELAGLERWISRGNTVLLLAALDDTPLWSVTAPSSFPELMQRVSRIRFIPEPQPAQALAQRAADMLRQTVDPLAAATELHPAGRHPLLAGVTRIATRSPLPSTQWRAQTLDATPVLELARRADNGEAALWLRPVGAGAIIISAYASPIANAVIGHEDNAALMSNVIAWSLGPRGRVIFDDAHQGALDDYEAAAFFADPRLHHTLWWIVGLWLAWVLGSQPLRAAAAFDDTLDESAMLRVSANFFANVLRPAVAARLLLEEFFNRARARLGMPLNGEPLWEWLAAQARLDPHTLQELRRLHARAQAGRRLDLLRLQTLLAEASGRL